MNNINTDFRAYFKADRIVKRQSNILSPNLQRSGLNIFPATLKRRSTGALEAGQARYVWANRDNMGNFDLFSFQ